jgi:hypothetical protein
MPGEFLHDRRDLAAERGEVETFVGEPRRATRGCRPP